VQHSVFFSAADIGNDPIVIRDWAQAVDDAGFDRICVAEHVVGGHPDRAAGHEPIHTSAVSYHEPFVLFGFMAAVTSRVELMTTVLVLPQRQTALVAKQAAELDVLSRGRCVLGVGVGRNFMEYEALNEDFGTRGRRLEEQLTVLRRLWTEDHVTFEGRWHHLDRIGLNPGPVRRPIPIWSGSFRGAVVEKVLARAATMSDGWLPQFPPDDEFRAVAERFWRYVDDAGRDRSSVGMDCPITVRKGDDPARWVDQAAAFEALGATHVRCMTMGGGFMTPQEHLDAALEWKAALSGSALR
jgi:probable F420-dependent oxidoreductase